MDGWAPLDPDEPVVHVSWFEADALARSFGARLPTEAEWEKAATWDQETGSARAFPWGDEPPDAGRANLDHGLLGPAPVGAYPAGGSPCGALGMLGDVWEWTSTDFHAYDGFVAHPYREYSEVFFGDDYKVLRGGSWATRARVATPTFRNWDLPYRRQIFSGVRLAWDALSAGTGTLRIDVHVGDGAPRALPEDVLDGLTRPFKELPPKHLYDARGAELFDRICELPEYYPTRTERAILRHDADAIVRRTGMAELVELGSGTASKTRVLLDAMERAGTLWRYVPFDVAEQTVRDCAAALADEYPALDIHGIVGDFERHLPEIPPPEPDRPRVVAFLGGTIGNFPPGARRRFLRAIAALLVPRRLPAARHRPRQGRRRAGGRLRRRGRRDRRVQPQRPARPQPRARRRLPDRAVRARRVLRPRARVDRDAPARAPRLPRADRRARPRRRVRARRGAAHRDLGQVHARRG